MELINDAKIFWWYGRSFISKPFSFKTANSSTIIQFLANLISAFLITSSKYFEILISETKTFASYGVNLNFLINLSFFSSGNSGNFFFIVSTKLCSILEVINQDLENIYNHGLLL